MDTLRLSTLTVAYVLSSFSAQAANLEIPFATLFQNSPAKLGRSIDSTKNKAARPTLRFSSSISFNQHGIAKIGDNCTLTQSTGHSLMGFVNSYFSTPLAHSPGGTIQANAVYELRLVSFKEELLELELFNKEEKVNRLELTCTHPQIQAWTVSDFETHLAQNAKIHFVPTKAQLKMKSHPALRESMLVKDLKGSKYNGWFGSGLPGTMGIQLLLGANLKAYADENNAPIVIGKRCKLVSQESEAINDQYLKGSKFAFRESRVKDDKGNVELIFNNWSHSPHELKVECKGNPINAAPMTVAEVERDLNGTIQFYHK